MFLIGWVARLRIWSLEGQDAARFMMQLDSRLYPLAGMAAVKYGDGIHPKHVSTGYHDFFVDRLQSSDWVLDIGCGNGCLSLDIARRSGARITAVDMNEQVLTEADDRHSHARIEYKCADITKNIPEGSYTVAMLSNVLEHVEDRVGLLRQVSAAGIDRFLIRVPCFERDWRVPLKDELQIDYRLDDTHCIEHRADQFVEEMTDAGLVVEELLGRWGEIWARLATKSTEAGDTPISSDSQEATPD